MYKKVDTSLNFVEREKEVIEFWKKNKIFEQSVEKNENAEEFSFYDGPLRQTESRTSGIF